MKNLNIKLIVVGTLLSFASAFRVNAQLKESILAKGFNLKFEDKAGYLFTSLSDSSIRLLAIDMRKVNVTQIMSQGKNGKGKGLYIKDSDSPYFERLSYESEIAKTNSNTFALINASFFEEYTDTTRLSFPIKNKGEVLTGGSSPYGPQANPKHEYYKTTQLLSLSFYNGKAEIQQFGTADRNVFQSDEIQNGIATYNYKDHPAVIIAKNRVTRFILAGTMDMDKEDGDEWLLIVIAKNTIGNVANVLKKVGVTSEILSFDGGSSVLLYGPKFGVIEHPGINSNVMTDWKLPHYIRFDLK